MKHLKIMGLAVVAATAFIAFAGSASAAPNPDKPGGHRVLRAAGLVDRVGHNGPVQSDLRERDMRRINN